MEEASPSAQMKKPPEGGFGVSWWPGAESNYHFRSSYPFLDYFQLRFNFLLEAAQSRK